MFIFHSQIEIILGFFVCEHLTNSDIQEICCFAWKKAKEYMGENKLISGRIKLQPFHVLTQLPPSFLLFKSK